MTRQCPLFHETVLAEWRCVVIQVLFNASYHTVFNVDNLVRLIGNAALVGYDHDGHARFMQVFQNLHDLYGSLAVESTGRFVGKDNLGRVINARAMATRCFCPPDISLGMW